MRYFYPFLILTFFAVAFSTIMIDLIDEGLERQFGEAENAIIQVLESR